MAWQDTLASLSAPPTPGQYAPPPPARLSAPGTASPPPTTTKLGSFSSPSLYAAPRRMPSQPVAAAPSAEPPVAPPQPYERVNVGLPFSTTEPNTQAVGPLRPASYRSWANQNVAQGAWDVAAQTAADIIRPEQGAGLNVGNFPAVIYQAPGGLIHALNDAIPNPVTGFAAGGFDAAMAGLATVSKPIADVMNLPIRILRDENLKGRARQYAALVAGPVSGRPFGSDPIENLRMLIAAATGTSEEKQRAITAAAFDLPPELKQAIEANPGAVMDPAKLDKLLSDTLDREGGRGRLWTYQGDIPGLVLNAVPDLAIFVAEMWLTRGALMPLKTAALASEIPAVAAAARGAGTALSVAGRMNGIAIKAGISAFAATAVLDAGGRVLGQQWAVNFATNAFSYHPISENPNVMFVTSFTVNPFHAIGALKRGVIRMGYGAEVSVGRVLGGKYARIYTAGDKLEEILGRIYGIPTASVPKAIQTYFRHRGEAMDHIVDLAAQDVVNRLPVDTRSWFATSYKNPRARAVAVMKQYRVEILDTLEKHVDRLADNMQVQYHAYRNYLDAYSPERALALGMDFRAFKSVTWRMMEELDAVAAYPEFLVPRASEAIRTAIGEIGDHIPLGAIDDLNSRYSALSNYVGAFKPLKGRKAIPRADVEAMLDRADADYAKAAATNPVLVRTGSEPVLRPNATARQYADAVGTTPDVIAAWRSGDPASAVESMRAFLSSKRAVFGLTDEEILAMDPTEVFYKAVDHIEKVTLPWEEMGARVERAESAAKAFRSRAAEEIRAGNKEEAARLLKEAAAQEDLIGQAARTLTPFTATLKHSTKGPDLSNAALRDLAARKVEAMRRLDHVAGIAEGIEALINQNETAETLLSRLHLTPGRERVWVYDTAPGVPQTIRAKLKAFLPYTPHQRVSLDEASNGELWRLVREYAGTLNANNKRLTLTAREAAFLRDAGPGTLDSVSALEDFVKPGVSASDLFDQLVKARQEIDAVIGHETLARLRTDRSRAVPQQYLDSAAADASDTTITHDYIAETEGAQVVVADMLQALDHPNDPAIYGSVERLALENRVVYANLSAVAEQKGITFGDFVRDPQYAAEVRDSLPKISVTPTPLDEAVVAFSAGDPAKLAAALGEVDLNAALGRPKPPVPNVPMEVAEALAKDKVPPDPAPPPSPELIAAREKVARIEAELTTLQAPDATLVQAFKDQITNVANGMPGIHPETGGALTGTRKAQLATLREGLRRARGVASGGPTAPGYVRSVDLEGGAPFKYVHYTTPEAAAQIQREGFRPGGLNGTDASLGGGSGVAVYLAQHGYGASEYMASEFSWKNGGKAPASLRVDARAATPVYEVQVPDFAHRWRDDLRRHGLADLIPEAEAEIGSDTSLFPVNRGIERVLARHGYAALDYGDELAVFKPDLLRYTNPKELPVEEAIKGLRVEWRAAKAELKRLEPAVVKERKPAAPRTASREYDAKLRAAQVDFDRMPDPGILARDENKVARQVLSLIWWGVPDRDPSTIGDVLAILREIENGNAQHAGFGPALLAKGQKLAEDLLGNAASRSEQHLFESGIFTKGTHPSMLPPTEYEVARRLFGENVVRYDPSNPIGLQYGFAKAPKNAVVLDFEGLGKLADETGVPGLAEELFTGHFQPYHQRILTAKVRQAFNYLFGPNASADIAAAAKSQFIRRASALGVRAEDAKVVWDAWGDHAHESNLKKLTRDPDTGRLGTASGALSLMQSTTNIPNGMLRDIAHKVIRNKYEGSLAGYDRVPFEELFREAYSGPMRFLADSGIPFGKKLHGLYNVVTNNDWVRWRYYQFRFSVDMRFHAMNAFEAGFLYAGRSALIPGSLDNGLLGATRDWLVRAGENHIGNTGYAFTRSRMLAAEKAFLKEQKGRLVGALGEIEKKDPALYEQAFRTEAALDPELSQIIAAMGDTPEAYLTAMDRQYNRILNSVDPAVPFEEQIAAELAKDPAMAEVYGHLSRVNRELWEDVKGTFLGDANRSRVERALNHYLLFWPFSYTLRTSKWLLRVMYDSAGGLPTNSVGAYQMDKLVGIHNQMLATNPKYAKWLKENQSLVFMAQMLFPITPNSIGFSLSPIMRDLFFGRTKAVWEIGPVYTISRLLPNVVGDLYANLSDVPVLGDISRAAVRMTGRTPKREAPTLDDTIVPRSN